MPVPNDRSPRGSGGSGHGGYGPGGYGSGHRGGYGPSHYDSFSCGWYYAGGRYYHGDGYYYSPYGAGLGFRRSSRPGRTVYPSSSQKNRQPVFFPPVPPPLDTPIPSQAMPDSGLVAPSELAAFVADPFYAPLSTRLAQGNLTAPLRRRLDAYRAEKAELQAQLHEKLAAVASADASAKENALADFAREQTPRIAALEVSAERLRGDLLRGGLVGLTSGTGDWNEHRTWRLGADRLTRDDDESLVPEFRVMRAAVYYEEALAPAQRRLLQEVAMELQAQAFTPPDRTNSTDDDRLVFFSPETARIRLPADLPKDLTERLAFYRREKAMLKTELRETLFEMDRAAKPARAKALQELADMQMPRFILLEQVAEEIRRGLAGRSDRPAAGAVPGFPPELADRIDAYWKRRVALQEEFQAKLEEIGRLLPSNQFTVAPTIAGPNGEEILTIELRPMARLGDTQRLIREDIVAFNAEQQKQTKALQQEWTKIRAATGAFVAANPNVAPGKSVDRLLQDFAVASGQKAARPLYEDYATAVLQPGLSPEQRRLLFDSALQKLALPLPGGEFQP